MTLTCHLSSALDTERFEYSGNWPQSHPCYFHYQHSAISGKCQLGEPCLRSPAASRVAELSGSVMGEK